jgi:hypothetical protein
MAKGDGHVFHERRSVSRERGLGARMAVSSTRRRDGSGLCPVDAARRRDRYRLVARMCRSELRALVAARFT